MCSLPSRWDGWPGSSRRSPRCRSSDGRWICTPPWRRWHDDDQRGLTRAGEAVGVARQGGDGRPGDVGGPTGEAGAGLRGRGAAGDLDPRRQGGPGRAGLARAAAQGRAGTTRRATGPDLAAALGPADGPDAGELRLRVPTGRAAVEARCAVDLRLAPGEAGTLDPGPARSRENTFSDLVGSQGGGEWLLGGVLPPGRAAARDAQGRGGTGDAPEGEEVHEGGSGDHR